MKKLKDIKDRWEKAAPKEKWIGHCNYPFYVILNKPRPSLSKHEGTNRGDNMWHMDDGLFIANAKSDMEELFRIIEQLEKFKHDVMWHFSTSFFLDNKTRDESLKKCINDFDKEYYNEKKD